MCGSPTIDVMVYAQFRGSPKSEVKLTTLIFYWNKLGCGNLFLTSTKASGALAVKNVWVYAPGG